MDLWLYSGPGSLYALTNHREGGNLPEDLGPWKVLRSVRLEGSSVDEQEAIALINEHGYCCFD